MRPVFAILTLSRSSTELIFGPLSLSLNSCRFVESAVGRPANSRSSLTPMLLFAKTIHKELLLFQDTFFQKTGRPHGSCALYFRKERSSHDQGR